MTEKGAKLLEAVKNGSTAIIGLGVSNIPLAEYLSALSRRLILRDAKERDKLPPKATELEDSGATLICGEEYLAGLKEDVIIRSPGIRPDIPQLAEAEKRGAVITCESEIFYELCSCRTVGITGSDGKTTTTTLTGLILNAAASERGGKEKALVGGNIGIPLIPLLSRLGAKDIAVTELSSFQLQAAKRSPEVAVITNITPNHLNWHTDMKEYTEAKKHIFASPQCKALVTNAENSITAAFAELPLQVTLFSSRSRPEKGERRIWLEDNCIKYENEQGETHILLDNTAKVLLPGKHNLENYLAACGAALACGYTPDEVAAAMEKTVTTFGGVEHRLELVGEYNGVKYYNSSIDSSPMRTTAALSTFPDRKSILICGGADKKIPFDLLAETLSQKARAVVVTGQAAPQILAAIEGCPACRENGLEVIHVPEFDCAVHKAKEIARPGERVLLSPACTSYDTFPNFEVRGRHFKELVHAFGNN